MASADQVRKARPGDVRALTQMLARAFDDDPLATWMFPEAVARKTRLPRLFLALLGVALPLDEVYTTDSLRASAIWNPPGTFPLGWRINARMGFTMTGLLRQRLIVLAPGLMYFDTHHPRDRHWYLTTLGTDPEYQGKGFGSAVLKPVLDRCDRTGEHAYLEASKEKNIAFYARYGFAVAEEMQLPRGPKVWPMWREPR